MEEGIEAMDVTWHFAVIVTSLADEEPARKKAFLIRLVNNRDGKTTMMSLAKKPARVEGLACVVCPYCQVTQFVEAVIIENCERSSDTSTSHSLLCANADCKSRFTVVEPYEVLLGPFLPELS